VDILLLEELQGFILIFHKAFKQNLHVFWVCFTTLKAYHSSACLQSILRYFLGQSQTDKCTVRHASNVLLCYSPVFGLHTNIFTSYNTGQILHYY
jgi:hypothetical protein